MQKRQAVYEGAYPLWSVTEYNAQYFAAFFRQKSVRVCGGADKTKATSQKMTD